MRKKLLFLGFFIGVSFIVFGVVWLIISSPELSADEVEAIVDAKLSSAFNILDVDYEGQGIWKVKTASAAGIIIFQYNEQTNKLIKVLRR